MWENKKKQKWHLVVALDVKVGEVDGDPPLGRGNDLPDAVLVTVHGDDHGHGHDQWMIMKEKLVMVLFAVSLMMIMMKFMIMMINKHDDEEENLG